MAEIREWSVFCEHCKWERHELTPRQAALDEGYGHVENKHPGDPEWGFRIKGVSTQPERDKAHAQIMRKIFLAMSPEEQLKAKFLLSTEEKQTLEELLTA